MLSVLETRASHFDYLHVVLLVVVLKVLPIENPNHTRFDDGYCDNRRSTCESIYLYLLSPRRTTRYLRMTKRDDTLTYLFNSVSRIRVEERNRSE